ncbi:hypothetical protein Tsubulata_015528 [Turnera subulata]|uniref:Uncharacterized protein n=1 Tax=Turnera subulata TaxID=218843 RepID=A0A9Q0F1W4_9ROSI|nr:hypothetical protein Tsubulata_015528 [Turnera subulata]
MGRGLRLLGGRLLRLVLEWALALRTLTVLLSLMGLPQSVLIIIRGLRLCRHRHRHLWRHPMFLLIRMARSEI